MTPKYEWHKVLKPHCSICKKQLRGDNSVVSPYTCECGEWKYDIDKGEFELVINK